MIAYLVTIIFFIVKYLEFMYGIRVWLGRDLDKYTANKGRNFCDMMYQYEIKIK
jgi:hypothetical protein